MRKSVTAKVKKTVSQESYAKRRSAVSLLYRCDAQRSPRLLQPIWRFGHGEFPHNAILLPIPRPHEIDLAQADTLHAAVIGW